MMRSCCLRELRNSSSFQSMSIQLAATRIVQKVRETEGGGALYIHRPGPILCATSENFRALHITPLDASPTPLPFHRPCAQGRPSLKTMC